MVKSFHLLDYLCKPTYWMATVARHCAACNQMHSCTPKKSMHERSLMNAQFPKRHLCEFTFSLRTIAVAYEICDLDRLKGQQNAIASLLGKRCRAAIRELKKGFPNDTPTAKHRTHRSVNTCLSWKGCVEDKARSLAARLSVRHSQLCLLLTV